MTLFQMFPASIAPRHYFEQTFVSLCQIPCLILQINLKFILHWYSHGLNSSKKHSKKQQTHKTWYVYLQNYTVMRMRTYVIQVHSKDREMCFNIFCLGIKVCTWPSARANFHPLFVLWYVAIFGTSTFCKTPSLLYMASYVLTDEIHKNEDIAIEQSDLALSLGNINWTFFVCPQLAVVRYNCLSVSS